MPLWAIMLKSDFRIIKFSVAKVIGLCGVNCLSVQINCIALYRNKGHDLEGFVKLSCIIMAQIQENML